MKRLLLLVMAFALLACATARGGAASASRDEARASVYAVEYGIHLVMQDCDVISVGLLRQGQFGTAKRLVSACAMVQATVPGIVDALERMNAPWTPAASKAVACDMAPAVAFYDEVQSATVVTPEVEDGAARARWLLSACR